MARYRVLKHCSYEQSGRPEARREWWPGGEIDTRKMPRGRPRLDVEFLLRDGAIEEIEG